MDGHCAQAAKPLFKRLPQTVVPTHYDLTIQPFLDKFKFNGDINIHLKVCCRIFVFFVLPSTIRLTNQQVVLYFMQLN